MHTVFEDKFIKIKPRRARSFYTTVKAVIRCHGKTPKLTVITLRLKEIKIFVLFPMRDAVLGILITIILNICFKAIQFGML